MQAETLLGDAPPGEAGWVIEIPSREPSVPASKQYLTLSSYGITTSGSTFRYLEIAGKRFSHIVDPRTDWGLTHHMLVTVLYVPIGVQGDPGCLTHHMLVTVQATNATEADA